MYVYLTCFTRQIGIAGSCNFRVLSGPHPNLSIYFLGNIQIGTKNVLEGKLCLERNLKPDLGKQFCVNPYSPPPPPPGGKESDPAIGAKKSLLISARDHLRTNENRTDRLGWGHRRRIKTEAKAKVVAAAWGTKLIQFIVAIWYQDDLKKRIKLILFFKATWCKISSAANNWRRPLPSLMFKFFGWGYSSQPGSIF